MEKTVQGVVLLYTLFVLLKNGVICERNSVWQTNTNCLQDAATFYESIYTFVCKNKSISEPVKWLPEICKDICTIEVNYSDCRDIAKISFSISAGTVAIFPLPKYAISGCANCHNISQVHITCSFMIPCIGITGELENSQTEEVISMITSEQTTKTYKPEAVSILTGNPAEFAVVGTVSGFIFGILATIGIWLLKQKISKYKSCSETKAQSHYASLDLRQPVGDLYTIIDKHKPTDDGGIYNNMNKLCTDPQETSSPSDEA